ncbi:hypothetical protein LCGC14_2045300 [marine sediment metagenome]|uniref:Uncharacterized protein n=1 Tax=marine sediment metagenome TaxID=412755 RepID=A0A0F9EQK6_9ZZZZ
MLIMGWLHTNLDYEKSKRCAGCGIDMPPLVIAFYLSFGKVKLFGERKTSQSVIYNELKHVDENGREYLLLTPVKRQCAKCDADYDARLKKMRENPVPGKKKGKKNVPF